MTGIDPDNVDRTFDDAQNAIFNSNYQLKVGTIVYQHDEVMSLVSSPTGTFSPMGPTCMTNKRRSEKFPLVGDRRFKLKVAINSWGVRSGAKGKVVSFKIKGNSWKRARASLAVFCGGTIYNSQCSNSFTFSDRNPSVSGFKKRKQLKISRHQAGSIWKTNYNELAASFEAQGIATGTLPLH